MRNDDYRQNFTEEDCKIGELRRKSDLYPYASGRGDDMVIHAVEKMLFHHVHIDRALWAIRTTMGRVIIVMQQFHKTDVEGEIEISNAPFRDTAVKTIAEDIIDFRALLHALQLVPSL